MMSLGYRLRISRIDVLAAAVVAAATLGRLLIASAFHSPGESVYSDMAVYHRQAVNLLRGTLSPADTFFPWGYPTFLAGVYALTGTSLRAIAVLQALAGGATCLLTYLIARRFAVPAVWSLGACAVVAIYPPFVYYGTMLLTESVAPFALMLTLWLTLRAADRPTWLRIGCAGLAFAATVAIRSNLILLLPVLATCVWIAFDRKMWEAGKFTAKLAIAALPVLAVISIHNSQLMGRPVALSTNGGVNFFLMHAEHNIVRYYDEGVGPIRNMMKYTKPFISPVPLYEEPYYYREGMRLALANGSTTLSRALENIGEGVGLGLQAYWPANRTLPVDDWTETDHVLERSVLRWCSRVFPWLLVMPPLIAIAVLARRRALLRPSNAPWILVVGSLAVMVATSLLFLADPRMHVPFDALLIVATADAARRGIAAFTPRG